MHVLHLIDSSESAASPSSLALLSDFLRSDTSHGHTFVFAGVSESPAEFRIHARVPDLSFRNPAAWLALRRALKTQVQAHLVHAMSLRGSFLAGLLAPRRPRLVTLTQPPQKHRLSIPEKLALRCPQTRFLVTHPDIRDSLVQRGIAEARVTVAQPAVDPVRLGKGARREIRGHWGVDDDSAKVILALGDPPSRVDALLALLSVGLAQESGLNTRLLISPRAAGLHRAHHVASTFERGLKILTDAAAERPWEIAHAVDGALVLAEGQSAAWAMAAGLPIVAPDTPAIRTQLAGESIALLAPKPSPGELARQICKIVDDRSLATRLGQAAANEARTRFDIHRFAAAWNGVATSLAHA